jgi:hypothetical protein
MKKLFIISFLALSAQASLPINAVIPQLIQSELLSYEEIKQLSDEELKNYKITLVKKGSKIMTETANRARTKEEEENLEELFNKMAQLENEVKVRHDVKIIMHNIVINSNINSNQPMNNSSKTT